MFFYSLACCRPLGAFAGDATAIDQAEPTGPAEQAAPFAWMPEWLREPWRFIKGKPAESAVHFGMWSRHFINNDDEYRTNHELLGACYNGYFLGTFKNSHSNRGWSGGVQRDVYRSGVRDASWRLGYRAGIVYGYDELSLFDTKLFPFVQTYADLSYKQGGVEISWAGSTVLLGFFWRI